MIRSEKKVQLEYSVEKIWEMMTDNQNYAWRTDISKIEEVDDHHFIEYTNDNFSTHFKILTKNPYEKYELELENKNMKGHFEAYLQKKEENLVELILIEEVEVQNFIMKCLAKPYLKKQQETYVKNLVIEAEKRKNA